VANLCSVVVAAVAGLLTRPCCVIPIALSVAGVGSVGLAQVEPSYRPAFISASAMLLGCSFWLTFRRPGGRFIKTLSAAATLVAFYYFSQGAL
jgi:hypothetical protein